jgi:hypothetical protein
MFVLNWLAIFRWLRILAGAAWLGEVVVIVFVLVPAVLRMPAAPDSSLASYLAFFDWPRCWRF